MTMTIGLINDALVISEEDKRLEDARITGIQLFELDYESCFHARKGRLTNCRYGVLLISCGSYSGWGECIMSSDDKAFDIIRWASFLHQLKRTTIRKALEITALHRIIWGDNRTDLVQTALLDLVARRQNVSIASHIMLRARPEPVRDAWANRYGKRNSVRHIHPGDRGTVTEMITYANHLWLQGYSLEIHKDYLIGPACSALKLLSDAIEAQWRENEDAWEPASLCNLISDPVGTGFDMHTDELFRRAMAYYEVLI
ncbi:hypothetical protein PM3016_1492 [Paenibacillus mucilaginosus 3016]|uniref:Uncharacterized protein n=1 Tax=Paenibacillus mucilaginosus 3016 TaxID=1116391 RepID=H6NGX5_9BACL|nr:hypothetical protein [Paenibacillus mucilaginosus]AFC28417.1 hypothetical protein PM3016_1492 [Paenibacillus mucilaginosus 3016]WFA17213.1 hypothetical protein ERY13_07825 [Paenibacillus mucilaginosus]